VLDAQVASLIDEIKRDVRPRGVGLEGVERVAAYDVIIAGAYGRRPDEVARLTGEARRQIDGRQRLRVGFRLGADTLEPPPAISGPQQARECVQAAMENGADSVFFYNYSESPEACLGWIKPAIAGMIVPPGAA
jgi:hypothetical protein